MKYGVPFDVAFAMSEGEPELNAMGLAMTVIFGEFEGGKFNWENFEWEKRQD